MGGGFEVATRRRFGGGVRAATRLKFSDSLSSLQSEYGNIFGIAQIHWLQLLNGILNTSNSYPLWSYYFVQVWLFEGLLSGPSLLF